MKQFTYITTLLIAATLFISTNAFASGLKSEGIVKSGTDITLENPAVTAYNDWKAGAVEQKELFIDDINAVKAAEDLSAEEVAALINPITDSAIATANECSSEYETLCNDMAGQIAEAILKVYTDAQA